MLEFIQNIPEWLTAIGLVVGAANAVTVLTPTKVDDKGLAFVNSVLRVLNVLSLNFGKNTNKDDY